mgnify:CR=1 FL=1
MHELGGDSSELFSDIEQFLKNKDGSGSCRGDAVSKEASLAETWLKRKVLKQFFEKNYTGCLGLYDDVMVHAKEMHREFKRFLSDQKEEYCESGDFGMESLVSEIHLEDALEHAEDNIRVADLLLSHEAYEYNGVNVAENKKVWEYLIRVIETAAVIDKKIQPS